MYLFFRKLKWLWLFGIRPSCHPILSVIIRVITDYRPNWTPRLRHSHTIEHLCFIFNRAELYKSGRRVSGVYPIDPDGLGAFNLYCDQTTAVGGRTLIQERMDGSVNFKRTQEDYKHGFGNLVGEFWLGLDKTNCLTRNKTKKATTTQAKVKENLQPHCGKRMWLFNVMK